MTLNIEAVRRRAEAIAGVREVVPPHGGVRTDQASFLVGLVEDAPPDANKLARVTIFQSGTITTSRILHSDVRHVFRRNVSELDVVERLLRDPPTLTVIDHSLIIYRDEKLTVKSEVELADVGLAMLQGEKEKLENHQSSLLMETSRNDKKRQQPASVIDLTQGMEFQFSLPASSMKHVDQCLSDINKMNKLVRMIATNGKGTVFLYGNGGVAYTPNIPRPMYQKLSQLRNSRMNSRPSYVSLGSKDRFFCAFHDGTFIFKGPKGLDKELKQCLNPPRSVAFANTWDSFFIVLSNGEWTHSGKSIPNGLKEKLDERKDKSDLLVCVNLGPSGEWFMKTEGGRMWWGGVHKETDLAIMQLMDDGHSLHTLDFGEDGSYFVSYD
jgi:hypothetical protein